MSDDSKTSLVKYKHDLMAAKAAYRELIAKQDAVRMTIAHLEGAVKALEEVKDGKSSVQ